MDGARLAFFFQTFFLFQETLNTWISIFLIYLSHFTCSTKKSPLTDFVLELITRIVHYINKAQINLYQSEWRKVQFTFLKIFLCY